MTVQKPGTQTRSFCYVSDMVDGLMRLMEGDDTGPINIGNPGKARNIPPLDKTQPNPTNLLNLCFVFDSLVSQVSLQWWSWLRQ